MKITEIIVGTQQEWKNLPPSFSLPVKIRIQSTQHISISSVPTNGILTIESGRCLLDSVTAFITGGSVTATGCTITCKSPDAYVKCIGSTIEARGSSTIEACGLSVVSVYGTTKVTMRDNATVHAFEHSRIFARGSSNIHAHDDSVVLAEDFCQVHAHNQVKVFLTELTRCIVHNNTVKVQAFDYATVLLADNFFSGLTEETAKNIQLHNNTQFLVKRYSEHSTSGAILNNMLATRAKGLQLSKEKNTPPRWLENEGIPINNDHVILYKRVSSSFRTQEGTPNETDWFPGLIVTHNPTTWNVKNECGPGKFHTCSRPFFCDTFRNIMDDVYVSIEVHVNELVTVEDPLYPHKIGFRTGKVLSKVQQLTGP